MIRGVKLVENEGVLTVNGKPYPVNDGRRTHYIIYPVKGTDGLWRAADVTAAGLSDPEKAPAKVTFDIRSFCETACDIHNDYVGFTKPEMTAIVKHYVPNLPKSAELPQCPKCLGEVDMDEMKLYGGICEECHLDKLEGGNQW